MRILITLLFTLFFGYVIGQSTEDSVLTQLRDVTVQPVDKDSVHTIIVGGQVMKALIDGPDTLYFVDLKNVNISSPRTFKDRSEYLKYLKYRRYANKVYPYAKQAIRIFKQAEEASATLKKRKRKKFLRKLAKELEQEFEAPLKKLSKTQGKIMVKMIERELETPMFELIKMTQGKFKAFYWNQSSKLYGYRLKTGYNLGDNPILDIVLQDFDISYDHVSTN